MAHIRTRTWALTRVSFAGYVGCALVTTTAFKLTDSGDTRQCLGHRRIWFLSSDVIAVDEPDEGGGRVHAARVF